MNNVGDRLRHHQQNSGGGRSLYGYKFRGPEVFPGMNYQMVQAAPSFDARNSGVQYEDLSEPACTVGFQHNGYQT
jgi:hypothetical protein